MVVDSGRTSHHHHDLCGPSGFCKHGKEWQGLDDKILPEICIVTTTLLVLKITEHWT